MMAKLLCLLTLTFYINVHTTSIRKLAKNIVKYRGLKPLRGTIPGGRRSALRCTSVDTTPFREAIRKLPGIIMTLWRACGHVRIHVC